MCGLVETSFLRLDCSALKKKKGEAAGVAEVSKILSKGDGSVH